VSVQGVWARTGALVYGASRWYKLSQIEGNGMNKFSGRTTACSSGSSPFDLLRYLSVTWMREETYVPSSSNYCLPVCMSRLAAIAR
jgi:hypothetical protein